MPIKGPDVLLYKKEDRIVTITLNRPERMNALSLELIERMEDAWEKFREDDDAWVAIVTGSGDKAFCAGFDLVDQAERDEKGETSPLILPRFYPYQIWKPVVAAINGYTVAGGWWLAQSCDVRISAEHAECGISEARWNMPAGWVYSLPRIVSMGHALEFALWGDARISAQRGYEIGWINRVVPKEKLMDEAMSWAERMLFLAPRCVRNLKEIIYRSYDMPSSEAEVFSNTLETNLFNMEDKIEGARAFTEKRKPIFKNK
jgi:enoyl-CoA hydratase/carnithine racemase